MAMSGNQPPAAPPWVGRMIPGRWYRISGEHPDLELSPTPPGTRYLEDTDPGRDPLLNPARTPKEWLRRLVGRRPHSPWHGRTGFSAITEACNGAVYASGFGACGSMIVFGGGHNTYFGSDVHAFDLGERQWSRISDGYLSGDVGAYGAGAVYPNAVYPDGSPLPPHTYHYVQYDPVGNDYLLLKGLTEMGPDVKATPIPHMFNLDSLTWRHGPKHSTAILNSGGWTTWDASRRVLWGHSGDDGGGNAFIGFRPDGSNSDGTFGSWLTHYPNKLPGMANHNAMQLDPNRDIIAVVVHGLDALCAINPKEPEGSLVTLSSSGTKPRLRGCAALDFAPNLDAFLYCSATDGGQVYSIEPTSGSTWPELRQATWVWQSMLDPGNHLDPIEDAAARTSHQINRGHTFGRFRVATYGSDDIAILVRHVDSPVYAMRLDSSQ